MGTCLLFFKVLIFSNEEMGDILVGKHENLSLTPPPNKTNIKSHV